MPDHVVQRPERNKDKEFLSSKTDLRESWLPYQSRWMARWRETGSSSSHAFEHHVISDANYKAQKREHTYFVVESMKSKEDSKVSMDMKTKNSFECITMRRYTPEELALTSDVDRYAHISVAENEEVNIMRSTMVKNNVKSLDPKTLSSKKLAVKNLPELALIENPINTQHSMYSDNVTLRMEHLPMFDINRRIESILSPKKRSKGGNMFVRPLQSHPPFSQSTLAPHVIEFASEESHFEARCISHTTEQQIRPYESMKDMLSYGDDLTRSSHLAIRRFEYNKSNRLSICNREENDPFICKENFASTDGTPLNIDMCNCFTHSTSMKQKTKSVHEMIDSDFRSSCSGLKGSSLLTLRDSCPGDTRFPFLAAEHGKAKRNTYGGEFLPIYESVHNHELSKDDGSESMHLSYKRPMSSIPDGKSLGACTTSDFVDNTNDEHPQFSKETQYLLITKKMGMETSPGDHMIRKSTISAQVKENDLLEMPILNSLSRCHFQQAVNSQPQMFLTTGEEVTGKDSSDIQYMDTWNRFSDKTDTSPEDPTSSYFEKDVVRHNFMRSKSKSSSMRQKSFLKKTAYSVLRELSTSRTESTGSDHILSYYEKPENDSDPLQESPSSPEPSSRGFKLDNSTPLHVNTSYLEQSNIWIKRLRHNPSDSRSVSTKRFKMADASYQGQTGDLFSKMLDCRNSSSNSPKCLRLLKVDDTSLLVKNSFEESKSVNSWTQRWSHHSQQVANHGKIATKVLCAPESSKVMHGNFDGNHFPSITAMALMGKATKNFRPCHFQKKGSLMVWNT